MGRSDKTDGLSMAGIKLEGFQGLAPRYSKRLLPPMAAQIAENTKLLAGEIRGFRALREEADLSGTASVVRRTIRIPGTPDVYKSFDSRDVDIIRSPLVADGFDRYYWAGDGRPKYNPVADIVAGSPDLFLGIPTPTTAPTVAAVVVGTDETRAYVYTFVSAYGEEGPPSPPTLAVGNVGQWDITAMPTTVPDAASRNITQKKIYRTITGSSGATTFFFVATIPLASSSYADNESSDTVASNNLLESTGFIEPPADLEGFVVMPNGYLVGWAKRRLVFSEPFRPHAWPAAYELGTEFDIVGLGVFGSTLVIATESQPYFGQGVTPASFTTQKLDAVEPCLSRRGIVSTLFGVYYPSINGLAMANGSGVQVITKDILTKEEWHNFFPELIYAAQEGIQYIAFTASNRGFLYDPQEGASKFVTLEGFTNVEGIETDYYTGTVYLLSNDRYLEFDPNDGTARLDWRWYSKTYQFPKPLNFGAARLNAEFGTINVIPDLGPFVTYNTAFFAAAPSINALGDEVVGGTPAPNSGEIVTVDPENRSPLGGSLMYDISYLSLQTNGVRLRVHVRDKVVFDRVITDESICRLPTGFKSDIWEFELLGNTSVFSLQVAETPNQLADI